MKQIPVKIGEGGRVVIPSQLRKMLGVKVGDELMLHMEYGRLVLMTKKQAIEYVHEQMNRYPTSSELISEELIAERKEEAKHE